MDATQEILTMPLAFLPLTSNNNVTHANALRMDWNDLLPAEECTYVVGNPPFYGARMQTKGRKEEIQEVFHGAKNSGNVDYVAGWYIKAVEYMADFPIRTAFVSTNSICQGEQVAIIWELIFRMGFHIDFAYDTFRWKNEANDQAHVFVVIVAFSKQSTRKRLFHHETPDDEAQLQFPDAINAYLRDAPDVFIWNRSKPICDVPKIGIGSQPIDDGNYLFTKDEMDEFLRNEPDAAVYFHPWLGAQEFINGKERYVLWLGNATEQELDDMPLAKERVEAVRSYRLASNRAQTRKAADTPKHFGTELIADSEAILIPKVSSERRDYIPMGFIEPDTFCSDLVFLISGATLYDFGILQSQFHNAWMRTVAGRLKSDYRYSGGVVYNNFVWPDAAPEQRQAIEQSARIVLDTRAAHPSKSLADLYDPDKMPADLLAAHKALDKAVEEAYGVNFNGDEEKIVAYLFRLYAEAVEAS